MLSRWRDQLSVRRNRWLLGLLVLVIAGRMALPLVVRRVAVAQTDAALVGRIELDDIDLSLLTGGITLHGLRIFARDLEPALPASGDAPVPSAAPESGPVAGVGAPGSAPVLSATRLSVDLGLLALFRKMVRIDGAELDGCAVSLDRAHDGTLVLPTAVESETPPEPQPEEGSGWGVLIQSIAVRDGRIGFRDFAVSDPPQGIEVSLPKLDAGKLALLITESGVEPGRIALDAGIESGTLHLEVTIESLADGPAYESHAVISNLPIGNVRFYIPKVGWSALAGRLDTDVVHRFESKGAHTLRGTVGLRELAVRVAGLDDPALAWNALGVEISGVDFVKQHAGIGNVSLDGVRVVTKPAGPEPLPVLRGLFEAATEDAVAAAPAAAAPATTAAPPSAALPSVAPPSPAPPFPPPSPAAAETPLEASPGATAPPVEAAQAGPATPAPGAQPSPASLALTGSEASSAVVATGAARVDAQSAGPWTWNVATVVVKDGHVQAVGGDGSADVGVAATLTNLASAPATHSTIRLALESESGGTMTLAGDLVVEPLGFDGTLNAEGVAVAPLLQPFATPQTRLLKNGVARLDLAIAAGATPKAPPAGVRVAGAIGCTDLDLTGDDPNVFALKWKEIAMDVREITVPGVLAATAGAQPAPIGVALASLTLTRPEIVLTRTESGVVLPEALGGLPAGDTTTSPGAAPGTGLPTTRPTPAAPAAAQPTTRASPPSPPTAVTAGAQPAAEVHVRNDRVTVKDMRIAVTDSTVRPFYRSTLDPVDLTAADLRWPGPFAKDVKLVAKGIDGATFTLTGNVAPAGSQLTAKLTGLPLAPFNPYATASGYSVTAGTASLESKLKFRPGSYDTTSKLVLNKLAVAGAGGDSLFMDRFGMPLSLALSLLTDVQGNIVLDVPIRGDARGARTEVGTVLAGALARAILNAVTSPLKLIGAVTSIGEKPTAVVPPPLVFQPGRDALAEGEEQKLGPVGGLLAAAPGLVLHLRGETGAEDRRWLQEQALRATLEKQSGVVGTLRYIGERGARNATLEVLTARAEGKPAEIPEEHKVWFETQVEAQRVEDASLQQLAEARAARVRSMLASGHGISEERVHVDPSTPPDLTARPAVAIGLGREAARVPSGGGEPGRPQSEPAPGPTSNPPSAAGTPAE